MNWKGIIGAGLTAVAGYLLYKTTQEAKQARPAPGFGKSARTSQFTKDGAPTEGTANDTCENVGVDSVCVNFIPPQASEGFFSLSHEKQISELITRIKDGTVDQVFNAISITWDNFGADQAEKKADRARNYTLELLVELIELKDERMMNETADVLTKMNDDGSFESKDVNKRIDDTDFKESLLYIIRDRLDQEHPLVDRVITAYHKEPNPYNRYRIVRALAIIGGPRVHDFLITVIENEAVENTFAYQVARKYVS
jgi:hypothetical protein